MITRYDPKTLKKLWNGTEAGARATIDGPRMAQAAEYDENTHGKATLQMRDSEDGKLHPQPGEKYYEVKPDGEKTPRYEFGTNTGPAPVYRMNEKTKLWRKSGPTS